MADPAPQRADLRFLTIRAGGALYALPADEVSEVIRIPALARVPLAPPGLLGLANLRGAVLPVASLSRLLLKGDAAPTRAVVLDGPAPVALAIDTVEALVSIAAGDVETRQTELAALPGERIRGAFPLPDGAVAKILDVGSLLSEAFVARPRAPRPARAATDLIQTGSNDPATAGEKLVTFEVAGQEFALSLDDVQEIVSAPQSVAAAPLAEAVVLGVMAYRDSLLPLLSLRGLLGFPELAGGDGHEKVVVTMVGGVLVGLVADRMRAIVTADPAFVEPTPPVLAARVGGESRVRAIYRGDGGRRLISILSPDQLFRDEVMQRLGDRSVAAPTSAATSQDPDLQILVFRLGEDEFGLPISVVDEVAPLPTQITRLPKTPRFLEGVINLRGEVLPIVDQRRRFDMPPATAPEGRRLVVIRTDRHRAGLIVDAVSEVLRTTSSKVEPAPDLAGETSRLVNGVVNLESTGRMILLLDPAELLTRAERALLDTFGADGGSATR